MSDESDRDDADRADDGDRPVADDGRPTGDDGRTNDGHEEDGGDRIADVEDVENVERVDNPYADFEPANSGTDANRDEGRSDGGTTEDVPAGVADAPGDDPFDGADVPPADDPFSEMDVGPMPEDDPLADDEEEPGSDLGSIVPEVQESAPDVDAETGEREAIVGKRRYCESCEHFSSPPEVACSNPGTEIREVVDVEHFRVHNCPVVARRRGLDWGAYDAEDAADAED